MQGVIDGKLYDTETAEIIGTCEYKHKECLEEEYDERGHCEKTWSPFMHTVTTIYRTKKGQYFTVDVVRRVGYRVTFWGGKEETFDETKRGFIQLVSPVKAFTLCRDAGLSEACSRIRKEDVEEG